MATSLSETRRFAESARASASRTRQLREKITKATGITSSGIVLVAVAILSWIVARVAGGRPLYLLSYGCLLVFFVSWAINRRPLPLEGRRSDTRPRVSEGELLEMQVGLTASRRLSTIILEEQVPPLLGQHARAAIASVESGENVDQGYKLACWRRGAYNVGPLVARWGDPFGLTQREMVLQEPFELLVHPSIEPVQDRPLTRLWEDPPIRPPVSKPWPSGMEFYGMREYAPGDDIRRIVWRAYARTGKLLVRQSEQGITDKITILVDTDRRYHSKGLISESFEMGVKAAASLGVRHLREGYQVTLEVNSARLAGPLRGGTSQMQLLDALARSTTERDTIAEPIARLIGNPSRDTHLVIMTPRLDTQAEARLTILRNRGVSILIAALIWDEEATDTLGRAVAMGCQVIELRPNAPLNAAFRHDVGAGRL